jgi:hypothetical protein
MPIDWEKIAEGLQDIVINFVTWMLAIKSPDETDFALWLLLWIPVVLLGLATGRRFIRKIWKW